jgi:hypothetical protein
MDLEISTRRIRVLPIVIDDCEIPAFLRNKLYADFRDPARFDEGVDSILRRFGIESPKKPAETVTRGGEPQAKSEAAAPGTSITIAEELHLLSMDDRGSDAFYRDNLPVVETALVGELIYRGRLRHADDGVHLVSDAPVGDTLLDTGLARVAKHLGKEGKAVLSYCISRGIALEYGGDDFDNYLVEKKVYGPWEGIPFLTRRRPFLAVQKQASVRSRFLDTVHKAERFDERTAIVAALAGASFSLSRGSALRRTLESVSAKARASSKLADELVNGLQIVHQEDIDASPNYACS